MKNILFLHAGAEMYGADKVLLDLITHLDKGEYKAFVILPSDGVLVQKLKENNINVEVVEYPILRRKYFNVKGILKYAFNFIKYSKIIYQYAKNNKIDIVHTNTAATLEGCYVSKKLKIPQIWSIHEIIVNPQIVYKLTSKIVAKYSNIVITDSCAVKNHLEKSGYFKENQIKVIYNGVDEQRFKPGNDYKYLYKEWKIPKDAKVLGMMGRVNSWKGQDDFLKAANIVMSKYSDVYTVFVGSAFEGEEWREKELEEKIKKSQYRDRIINKGYRTDSEAIYNLFDIFVLPSTNPDPLPTVVLENMASGNPIVGYRHGGICEMVKENYNGLLARVRDTDDLASKIEILLNNTEKMKEMGINSRKRLLENFSMKSYVYNYCKQYDLLIQTK